MGRGGRSWRKQARAGVNMPFYQEPLDAALWFKRVDLIATGRIGSLETPFVMRPIC